jgi:hypothetical protein
MPSRTDVRRLLRQEVARAVVAADDLAADAVDDARLQTPHRVPAAPVGVVGHVAPSGRS